MITTALIACTFVAGVAFGAALLFLCAVLYCQPDESEEARWREALKR